MLSEQGKENDFTKERTRFKGQRGTDLSHSFRKSKLYHKMVNIYRARPNLPIWELRNKAIDKIYHILSKKAPCIGPFFLRKVNDSRSRLVTVIGIGSRTAIYFILFLLLIPTFFHLFNNRFSVPVISALKIVSFFTRDPKPLWQSDW